MDGGAGDGELPALEGNGHEPEHDGAGLDEEEDEVELDSDEPGVKTTLLGPMLVAWPWSIKPTE